MNQQYSEPAIINAATSWPSVSLILPIDTKISVKSELAQSLKTVTDKIKHELHAHYPEDRYMPVLEKIKGIAAEIEPVEKAKSLAIFVSPEISKVYFLDIPSEEKIFIDDSFEIRDLVYSKAAETKYLVLVLAADHAKAYTAVNNRLDKIALKASQYAQVFNTENTKEQVANFTDPAAIKETKQDKFLRHVDAELSSLVQKEHLPVFVLGVDRVLGHFKNITANAGSIAGTIQGNYIDATVPELKAVLAPELAEWKKNENNKTIASLEEAADQHRIAKGMNEVWKAAHNRLGQLLVVEKNFSNEKKNSLENSNPILYTRDSVDEVIELVLQSGGKVVFADDGTLDVYGHIALVQYYQS